MSKETVPVAIDELSELWTTRNRLLAEIEQRKDAVTQIDAILKERLPDEPSVTALIAGKAAFTYDYQRRYQETAFKEDYPALFKEYAKPALVDKMDWVKFAEQHPSIAQKYQVRALVPARARRHDR